MTRRRQAAVIALGWLLGACRTRLADDAPPREGWDGAFAGVDLATTPLDARVTPRCVRHQLVETPLVQLEFLDGPPPTWGLAVRLRLGVPLRDCDVLGSIDVQINSGDATDGVDVVAHVWRGDGACSAAAVVTRVVTLDGAPDGLDNFDLFVRDRAPGGTLTLHATLGGPITSDCQSRPVGAVCWHDCQCRATDDRAHCVTAVNKPVCVIPCSEDVDCPQLEPQLCSPMGGGLGPPFICVSPPQNCQCGATCPFGQACQGCGCRPTPRPLPPSSCRCDSDCGDGRICRSDGTCIIPCTTVKDCPPGANVCNDSCDSTI